MKFACLCLNAIQANELIDADGALPCGFRIRPPNEPFDLKTWRESVGSWQIDAINACNVRVWTSAESERPDTDVENQHLVESLHSFWRALQLCRPTQVHSACILSGGLRSSRPHVSSFSQLSDIYIKEPPVPLTIDRLRDAAEIAGHLDNAFSNDLLRGRVERGLTAFFSAMSSRFVDESILSLQRALEGILHPANKAQFTKRVSCVFQIEGISAMDLFDEIYDVRSRFTHAEPLEAAFPGKSRDEALKRALQLQTVLYLSASRAYCTVIADPALVRRFSAEGQGEYWGKVTSGTKKPPFVVRIAKDELLFEHTDTHRLYTDDAFAYRSNFALQPTSPSRTLGPRG